MQAVLAGYVSVLLLAALVRVHVQQYDLRTAETSPGDAGAYDGQVVGMMAAMPIILVIYLFAAIMSQAMYGSWLPMMAWFGLVVSYFVLLWVQGKERDE